MTMRAISVYHHYFFSTINFCSWTVTGSLTDMWYSEWKLIYIIYASPPYIKSADKQTVGVERRRRIIFQWLRKYLRLHAYIESGDRQLLLSSVEARERVFLLCSTRNILVHCSCTHHIKTRSSLKLDIHYGFHRLPFHPMVSYLFTLVPLQKEPGVAGWKCSWKIKVVIIHFRRGERKRETDEMRAENKIRRRSTLEILRQRFMEYIRYFFVLFLIRSCLQFFSQLTPCAEHQDLLTNTFVK